MESDKREKGKFRYAKVGTQPALIVFKYNYKLEKGKKIQFRLSNSNIYHSGIIDDFNDSIIFISFI